MFLIRSIVARLAYKQELFFDVPAQTHYQNLLALCPRTKISRRLEDTFIKRLFSFHFYIHELDCTSQHIALYFAYVKALAVSGTFLEFLLGETRGKLLPLALEKRAARSCSFAMRRKRVRL